MKNVITKRRNRMKTKEKITKVFELTQKELIAAIRDYVSKRVKLSGVVTIKCETENGGRINLLPMNEEEGEEIITRIEMSDIEPPSLDILKGKKSDTSPILE